MSKKKPLFISDQKKGELAGFEEVLDLVGKDGTQIRTTKKEAQIEDYEIYDFLEKENARLEKLDQFFTTQMPLIKKYPQTEGLIKKEYDETNLIKDELITKLQREDSPLFHFLNQVFKNSF